MSRRDRLVPLKRPERLCLAIVLPAFLLCIALVPAASRAATAQEGVFSTVTTTSMTTTTATTTVTTIVTTTTTTIITSLMTPSAPNPYRSASARMQKHFEPSYMTAGGGINRTDAIDFGDLFYEAQIYVHYTWNDTADRKSPPQGDDHVRIVLPIRLQVRQYRTDSSPVKTPSYNPGLRFYYTRNSWIREQGMFYLSAGFHHYSNGQNGAPRNADGTANTENGSFSTDYTELSLYWDRVVTWTKFNLRTYLVSNHLTWEPAQSHYYERGVAEVTWRYNRKGENRHPDVIRDDPGMTYQLTGGYKYGRDYVSPGVNASFKDNLQWTAEAFIPSQVFCKKLRWKDVQLYVRYDRGYDNYNIHYQEQMERIQFGIVASNY